MKWCFITILDFNKGERVEASIVDKKKLEAAKTVDVKGLERKTSSSVNGISEDTNIISVTESLRPYHEKQTAAKDIPNSKGPFHEKSEDVEESDDDVDEDEDDDETEHKSNDEEASPKVADFDFEVSSTHYYIWRKYSPYHIKYTTNK